jgi:putative membrane protein
MRLLSHWLTLVLGLYLISLISPLGIGFDRPRDLVLAALILMVFNAIVKPILILITLPLVLLSLGIFLLIINALLLYWIPTFVHGFHVPGFWSAFFGAILLSFITGFFSGWEKRSRRHSSVPASRGSGPVIDV